MSNVKATIQNVDEGGTFTVQFNPKEFKLDEKANWKASDEHQKDKPLLTYEKGEPSVLTVDLVFDTTEGGNVYTQFVKPLRAMLTADVSKADAQGNNIKRPPYLIFSWGGFTMNCVCEKLSTTFLMFDTSGSPIRAKVQVALKERDKPDHGSTASSGAGVVLTAGMLAAGGAGSAAYVAQPGDTLNRIASKTKKKPEDIALANNITDPMEIQAGRRLVIPANAAVAQVLAQQGRRRQDGNWRTTAAGGPGPQARGGFFGSVPSAFDETPPVALDYDVRPGGIADQFASFGPMTYESRTDSDLARTEGTGIALGGQGESSDAESFRNTANPGGPFERAAGQGYGGHRESDEADNSGDGASYGGQGESSDAESFRNTANPGGPFERAAGQAYGGQRESDEADNSGDGASYGGHGESSDAESFRNTANPGGPFERAAGQAYGGQRESDEADNSGDGASYGGQGESSDAGSFRNTANPGGPFARSAGQGYGGQGPSGEADTSGDGATLGSAAGGSDAGAFRNDARPAAGFDRPEAQTFGHRPSDAAGGSAGEGATVGGHRPSGDATGSSGEGGGGADGSSAVGGGGGGARQDSDGSNALAGAPAGPVGGAGGGARRDVNGDGKVNKGDFAAAFKAAKEAAEKTKKGD